MVVRTSIALHRVTFGTRGCMKDTAKIVYHVSSGQVCCDAVWEAAYNRFETQDQEIAKFLRRFRELGVEKMNRQMVFVELFCGRGNGLRALESLGFQNIHGVDLSESLLKQYRGAAQLHLADCCQLPFENESIDCVVIQGGLHHLEDIEVTLPKVLDEIVRVLRSEGQFVLVEPWSTPFLTIVHLLIRQPWLRSRWSKADALATMVEREYPTYFAWLSKPKSIRNNIDSRFKRRYQRVGFGKLTYLGEKHAGNTTCDEE
jgi:ubiquinone/menaquinone biosynthesis C-methylase UbiE